MQKTVLIKTVKKEKNKTQRGILTLIRALLLPVTLQFPFQNNHHGSMALQSSIMSQNTIKASKDYSERTVYSLN